MTDRRIPEDIAQFILENIDSVAQMEALILLRGDPEREWSAEELARRLYISGEETAAVLLHLCARGFLGADPTDPPRYRYAPASSELGRMADRAVELYSKHLVPVTHLIHSKPKPARVQEFAEAFRLRKDK